MNMVSYLPPGLSQNAQGARPVKGNSMQSVKMYRDQQETFFHLCLVTLVQAIGRGKFFPISNCLVAEVLLKNRLFRK